jgi:hypothetical protein
MHRFLITLLAALGLVMMPTQAIAQDDDSAGDDDDSAAVVELADDDSADVVLEVPEEDDVVGIVESLALSIQSKNWMLVVGMCIMLIVWALNHVVFRFWQPGPKWLTALPWIAVLVSAAGQLGAGLAGGMELLPALNASLVTGFAAGGMWSAGGKLLLPKPAAMSKP